MTKSKTFFAHLGQRPRENIGAEYKYNFFKI